MTNAQTTELVTMARAASVTSEALLAFQKSIANVMDADSDADMDILKPQATGGITERQREFLAKLIKINVMDREERENKLSEIESFSREDANVAIKQFVR